MFSDGAMNATTPSRLFIDLTSALRNACDIVFFASTTIYTWILLKKRVFHPNLLTLLILSPLSFILALLPNIISDMINWFTPLSKRQDMLIMMTVDIGQFSSGYNLFVLVTERAIATLQVVKYENMCNKVPWFAIGLSALQWCCSIILLYLNYNGEYVKSEVLVASILIECILSAVVFSLLPRVSYRIYKRELARRFGTISRYQSIENLRSATVLRRLVLSTVFSVFIMLSTYSCIRFFVDPPLRPPLFNVHFAIVATAATLLNMIVLISHPTLLAELRRITGLNKGKLTDKVGTSKISSVHGTRLDVPTAEQTQAYFESYRNTWN